MTAFVDAGAVIRNPVAQLPSSVLLLVRRLCIASCHERYENHGPGWPMDPGGSTPWCCRLAAAVAEGAVAAVRGVAVEPTAKKGWRRGKHASRDQDSWLERTRLRVRWLHGRMIRCRRCLARVLLSSMALGAKSACAFRRLLGEFCQKRRNVRHGSCRKYVRRALRGPFGLHRLASAFKVDQCHDE